MPSYSLRFSKIQCLDEYDDHFEQNQIHFLEETTVHDIESMRKKLDSTILFVSSLLKEYFLRVKLEKELSISYQQESSISLKLSNLKKKLQRRKNEKEDTDAKKALRLSQVQLFEENLSLKVSSTNGKIPISKDEDAVSFVFHNIDENHPQTTYSFILITDGSIYKVANCQPPVEEIKDFLITLNKTNDLRSFIMRMRKCFVEIALSST